MTVENMDKAAGLSQGIAASKNYLSKNDALLLLEFMDASTICNEEEDFRSLLKCFGKLFGAEFSLCLLAALNQTGQVASVDVLNANFPSDWLKLYMAKGSYNVD